MRFLNELFTARLTVTLSVNILCVVVIVALRFMIPMGFQRPALSLPAVDEFSIANWFANRLAEAVDLLLDLLRSLLG